VTNPKRQTIRLRKSLIMGCLIDKQLEKNK
jgi:hypothetical protein